MEDAEEVTEVMDVRSAHPLSLAFWYCLHLDSSSLHWVRRDWQVQLGLVLLANPVSGLMDIALGVAGP